MRGKKKPPPAVAASGQTALVPASSGPTTRSAGASTFVPAIVSPVRAVSVRRTVLQPTPLVLSPTATVSSATEDIPSVVTDSQLQSPESNSGKLDRPVTSLQALSPTASAQYLAPVPVPQLTQSQLLASVPNSGGSDTLAPAPAPALSHGLVNATSALDPSLAIRNRFVKTNEISSDPSQRRPQSGPPAGPEPGSMRWLSDHNLLQFADEFQRRRWNSVQAIQHISGRQLESVAAMDGLPDLVRCINGVQTIDFLLGRLGMEQYANEFAVNGWDTAQSFRLMQEKHLMECGVVMPGHRAILLREIDRLNEEYGLYDGTKPRQTASRTPATTSVGTSAAGLLSGMTGMWAQSPNVSHDVSSEVPTYDVSVRPRKYEPDSAGRTTNELCIHPICLTVIAVGVLSVILAAGLVSPRASVAPVDPLPLHPNPASPEPDYKPPVIAVPEQRTAVFHERYIPILVRMVSYRQMLLVQSTAVLFGTPSDSSAQLVNILKRYASDLELFVSKLGDSGATAGVGCIQLMQTLRDSSVFENALRLCVPPETRITPTAFAPLRKLLDLSGPEHEPYLILSVGRPEMGKSETIYRLGGLPAPVRGEPTKELTCHRHPKHSNVFFIDTPAIDSWTATAQWWPLLSPPTRRSVLYISDIRFAHLENPLWSEVSKAVAGDRLLYLFVRGGLVMKDEMLRHKRDCCKEQLDQRAGLLTPRPNPMLFVELDQDEWPNNLSPFAVVPVIAISNWIESQIASSP